METDKAAVEIPSPADGTVVDVCVSAGDTVEISQVLVRMNGDDEGREPPEDAARGRRRGKTRRGASATPRKENPKKRKNRPRHPKAAPADDIAPPGPLAVAAAPSVRRLARELGVELPSVSGTGPRGRILEKDVKAHVKAIIRSASSAQPAAPPEPELPDFSRWGETVTESFSTVRKLTAERLSQAWGGPLT